MAAEHLPHLREGFSHEKMQNNAKTIRKQCGNNEKQWETMRKQYRFKYVIKDCFKKEKPGEGGVI